MLTPLALFLGLLAATAFIAHWSDNLGKKLGKKRVSVFGLRPRTSATLLTVASSWGIMLFTLVALLLTVTPLREALLTYDAKRAQFTSDEKRFKGAETRFKAEEARFVRERTRFASEENRFNTERARFINEKNQLSAQRQKAISQAQGARKNLQEVTARLTSTTNAQKAAERGQRQAEQGTRRAQNAAEQAQSVAARARSAAQSARSQEQNMRFQLTTTKASLNQNKTLLFQNQNLLSQRKRELSKTNKQLEQTNKSLRTSRQLLATSRAKLKASYVNLATSYKELAGAYKEVNKAKKEVAQKKKDVASLQSQRDALQKNVSALGYFANESVQLVEQLAFADIRVPVDQTLAERRIDANQSPAQIEQQLHFLVAESQSAAQKLVPGVKVVARAVARGEDGQTPIQLDEREAIARYARVLSVANQPVSARLASAFNYPGDVSQIFARFIFVQVRPIYQARDTIGAMTIDGEQNEAALFGQLNRLVELARINAVQQGANPPLSPNERNFFDVHTGQKMFSALRQIQQKGRKVEVRVVAARDLDAAEPLQIRFEVGDSA